jgi:hypothetical protein
VLRRWGIRRLEVKLSKLPLLVMVICILHNLAIPRDGRELPGLRALRRAAHGAFGTERAAPARLPIPARPTPAPSYPRTLPSRRALPLPCAAASTTTDAPRRAPAAQPQLGAGRPPVPVPNCPLARAAGSRARAPAAVRGALGGSARD